MMLIEAMKKLRLIEKKMSGNCESITRYSSMVSTEKTYFESEDAQRREVVGLVQSNVDFMKEYLRLKQDIEFTNLITYVRMGDEQYSISELLVIKRKMAQMMMATFDAMNDSAGQQRLRHATGTTPTPAHLVRLYNEKVRSDGLRSWQDLYHEVDSRLEVVNATTELREDMNLSE